MSKPALHPGDEVFVNPLKSAEIQTNAIRPVLSEFAGEIVEINDDDTAQVNDGDGQVFDSIPTSWIDLICPDCGSPMSPYMDDPDGTNLEDQYGCRVCGHIP